MDWKFEGTADVVLEGFDESCFGESFLGVGRVSISFK